ncbi:zinc finger CCHC domain-containing protein 9-like isoform X2 [Oxyura jamaicensis]|uniref:zinc finger CCHC domain-containing protein 9-like isoform X2 n=1 Tax=Oxyura jamaicensis TaxID=8884 RepID=UPI0015A6A620|nr:zinc finger CCHC domain-containing protein 9-like isoform X2 [Oxyura jamaicensis]
MTRWARKAAAEGGKALPATPWEEMAAAPARKRRRKEYADRDVNGFAAHLGKAAGGGAAEGEEETAAAVRKALRREGRRLRRQEARRNAMGTRPWCC